MGHLDIHSIYEGSELRMQQRLTWGRPKEARLHICAPTNIHPHNHSTFIPTYCTLFSGIGKQECEKNIQTLHRKLHHCVSILHVHILLFHHGSQNLLTVLVLFVRLIHLWLVFNIISQCILIFQTPGRLIILEIMAHGDLKKQTLLWHVLSMNVEKHALHSLRWRILMLIKL